MGSEIKYLLFSFLLVLIFSPVAYSETVIIDKYIVYGSDDASQSNSSYSNMRVTSTVAYVGDTKNNTMGLRFNDIDIPPDATIDSAVIEVKLNSSPSSSVCDTIIYAQQGSDLFTFDSSTNYNITDRITASSSSISWPIPSGYGEKTSPDISAVIQEVVDHGTLENGNSIVIIIQPLNGEPKFQFSTYENNFDSWLHIEYTTAVAPVSPPIISASPLVSIGANAIVGTDAGSRTFTLHNTGPSTLNYTIDDSSAGWFTCDPLIGDLAAGASTPITVTYGTSSLSVDDYDATITIADRDVDGDSLAADFSYSVRVKITEEVTGSICGDVPVYTENLVNPAILLLLDVSGSMAEDALLAADDIVIQQTPDLKTIVQEIVYRSGWLSGNPMVFFGKVTKGGRSAVSHNASGDLAPLLYVKYTSAAGDNIIIERRIDQNSDDAEQLTSMGPNKTTNIANSRLRFENGFTVGLRFRNLTIPPGATIQNAHIEFVAERAGDSDTNVTISGQADDFPATFKDDPRDDLSDRTSHITASVAWNSVPAWVAPASEARLTIAQDVLSDLVTDRSVAWGFGSWTNENASADNYTDIHVGTKPYSVTQEQDLLTAINATVANGGTPLTPSLRAGKDYFAGSRADEVSSATYADLVCQPKMVIEVTDGIGNTDTTVANIATTTADLAAADITVVGVGFSIGDAVQLDKLAEVSNEKGADDGDAIYALHKEDANGDAKPFLANSKDELVAALNDITASLKGEIFYGSAPAPTTSVDYGNIVITAQFSAVDWSGDLIANKYDPDSGALVSANWSALDEMPSGNSISAFTLNSSDAVISYSTGGLEEFYLCKPLGDIINSTPIIVEGPPFNYSFNDYDTFKQQRRDRLDLVYVGANDGALHAFGLADGVEKWRFYPKSIQAGLNPSLVGTKEDLCFSTREPAGEYCHKYFVDGAPVAADVFNGTWSTILVTGLGHGGSSYFALDVSGGSVFGSGDDAVSYLWELTDTDIGFATSEPAISRVSDATWAVFFGAGYSVSNMTTKKAYLFGLHALDKSPLWKDSSDNPISKVRVGTWLNDALSSPLVVDTNDDAIDDHIYTGNLYGSMYRVIDIGAAETPTISRLFDFGRTSHVNPLRAKAAFAYDETDENVWIYFGSGKYENSADKTTMTQQYFLGLKDNDTLRLTTATGKATYFWDAGSNAIGTPSKAIKAITANKITVTHADDSESSYRTLDGCTDTDGSWLIKLMADAEMNGSERVISEPMVARGIVFFTTFVPDEDVCAGNGEAWLYAVEYKTGCPATGDKSTFDINGDGLFDENDMINEQAIAGLYIGSGQPSKPVLEGDIIFVTTTASGLKKKKIRPRGGADPDPDPDLPGWIKSMTLKSWRTVEK